MRILWFTNTLIPGKEQSEMHTLRAGGGWMLALCQAMREAHKELKLAIASTRPVSSLEKYTTGDIDCFVVPMRNKDSRKSEANALRICSDIVREWAPDVIHVHGTERFFGLLFARGMVGVPTVISIQGLLKPYAEWHHYFGNRSLIELVRMHRFIEIPAMRGQIWNYCRLRRNVERETEIIRGNRHFMGRTAWDRAHLWNINPDARYYPAGEVLRPPFWEARWDLSGCRRHRIVFTNPGHPRKGTEILLNAADALHRDFPDIEVALIGELSSRSGYGRYIRKEIRARSRFVRELGPLNAEEMARELIRSHLFVSPSYIDNSPNAVCEAQLVGMPVISSYTGGVPSLIEEGRTGLFFQTGDVPMLASRLREVFENDALAVRLGGAAWEAARMRHDPHIVVQQVLSAYDGALGKAGKNSNFVEAFN